MSQRYPDDANDTTGTAIHSARGNTAVPYKRRRPEETTLYEVVLDHVETFLPKST